MCVGESEHKRTPGQESFTALNDIMIRFSAMACLNSMKIEAKAEYLIA